MQQWFTLSHLAMQKLFFDTPLCREFVQLEEFCCLPDESIILRFRRSLQKYKFTEKILATVNELLILRSLIQKTVMVVDATLMAALNSTKNKNKNNGKVCDHETHSSKMNYQCCFGMKVYIGVTAESGLVHTVPGKSGNVSDIAEANTVRHVEETSACGDAGYQRVDRRMDAKENAAWHIAMRAGKRHPLDTKNETDSLIDQAEKLKDSARAKMGSPFSVIKPQFRFVCVRWRGLKNDTALLFTLFTLPELWMGAQHTAH